MDRWIFLPIHSFLIIGCHLKSNLLQIDFQVNGRSFEVSLRYEYHIAHFDRIGQSSLRTLKTELTLLYKGASAMMVVALIASLTTVVTKMLNVTNWNH